MGPPVFRISEDNPGRRMHLVSTSGPPRGWLRWVGIVVLLGVPVAVGAILYELFGQQFIALMQQDAGAKFTLGFVLVLAAIMVLAAMQFVGKGVAQATGYVRDVNLDVNTGQIEVFHRGWLWWKNRRERVALESIKRLVLTTGPLGDVPPLLELEVEYAVENELEDVLVIRGQIERVEDRETAVEWVFRVGQIAQLIGYGIRRNDEQDLEVVVTRKVPLKSKLTPLPSAQSGTRFELPPAKDIVAQASARQKRFRPESLAEYVTFTKIEVWQPGEKVHFVRDAIPGGAVIVLGVLGCGIGAVLAAFPLYEMLGRILVSAPRWMYATGMGALAGSLVMYIAATRFRRTEAVFNWGRREVHLVDGRRHADVGFNQIEGLLLRGVRRESQVGSSSRRRAQRLADYRARLELVTGQRNYLLIESDQYESSPITAQRRLAPLAQELAAALEQTWGWEDYTSGTAAVRYERWRLRPMEMVLLLLAGLCLAGFFTWRGQARRADEAAVELVAQSGVKISFSNGYTFQDIRVAEDYWSVAFEERGSDERVRRVVEPLRQLPRVAVDLSGSPITDDAMGALSEVPGLTSLFVSLTSVSDAGIAKLAEADELVLLGATRTRITDASLAEIAKLPRLRVLLVGFNEITDEGLRHLQACKSLEWVHVIDTQVTPAGVAELQRARPGLHIEHAR